jgi:hypothetical protein
VTVSPLATSSTDFQVFPMSTPTSIIQYQNSIYFSSLPKNRSSSLAKMVSAIITITHAIQAAFSGYNLYLTSIAIPKLQKYEDASKKAAKFSNIAETQLYKTRTTQASGTLAVRPMCFPSFPPSSGQARLSTHTYHTIDPLLIYKLRGFGHLSNCKLKSIGVSQSRDCSSQCCRIGSSEKARERFLERKGKATTAEGWRL